MLLRELLAEAAKTLDVRVLLWAGAPVPVFSPRRSSVRDARDELVRGTRIRSALDSNERPLHCHHEKIVMVDDDLAFVGGIDLTDLGGDRWDTPAHPARGRLGWHDVASRIRGPAVADVRVTSRSAGTRSPATRSRSARSSEPAGEVELQVVRTVPEKLYDFAPARRLPDRRGLPARPALRDALRLSRETSSCWSPEVVSLLADKLRHPPADDFRVVVMIPSKANNGQDDTRGQLAVLVDADDGHGRFLATTIRARTGTTTDRVYVHANVWHRRRPLRWLTLARRTSTRTRSSTTAR